MHSNMFAHRDLKLENILVTRGMKPKLADFSFTIEWDGRTPCVQWCGSIMYFSPELLRNEPYNPLRSDIWAVGVCLFIMSNDSFPFKHTQGEDDLMLQAQMGKKWKLRNRTEQKYSADYKDLIKGMLEPHPSRRLSAQQIGDHPWLLTNHSPR